MNVYVGDAHSNQLYHYGIKGQKWGVRRYQYPDGRWTEAGKLRYGRGGEEDYGTSNMSHNGKDITKDVIAAVGKVMVGSIFKNPKAVLTSFPNIADAMSKSYRVAESYLRGRVLDARRESAGVDPKTGLKLKASRMTRTEDLEAVNPPIPLLNASRGTNCVMCTAAYIMRRRGYEVSAGTTSRKGLSEETFKEWFPDAKASKLFKRRQYKTQEAYAADVIEKLKSHGSRTMGSLFITYHSPGLGHCVAYEVVNGRLLILDGQNNQIFSEKENSLNEFFDDVKTLSYINLTGLKFDSDKIKEALI